MHIVDIRDSGGQFIVLGGAFTLPTSNNAVVTPANGSLRWNVSTLAVEYFNGGWIPINFGGVNYVGVWNATTNSPHLTSGIGAKGNYYKVSVAGTTMLDGLNQWNIGDSVIFDGTTWDRLAGSDFATITLTGDATGSGSTFIPVTLAASGVTAGTYTKVTVDAKGRVTVGATVALSDLTDVVITTPLIDQILAYDGTDWGNVSPPYDIYGTFIGSMADSQTLWRIVIARPVTFPLHLAGSVAICVGAPLTSVSLPILMNGVQIGSIDFLSGTTQANFTFVTETIFDSGDVLEVDAPSPADATFYSPSWAFSCHR
jgi:hypothetical protein